MRAEVVQQLLALNREFYSRFAEPFSETRAAPQPGFKRLLEELPAPCKTLLDLGCGDGRLGRFFLARGAIQTYVGVDFNEKMLNRARSDMVGEFVLRDLSQRGCLDDLDRFDAIACLATLQHIPGRFNRLNLLQEMRRHLDIGGRVMLSSWQFLDSPRQRRKVVDWKEVGLTPGQVEPSDFLLTWQRGGFGLRYVCYIDPDETAALAGEAGLQISNQFRSDGREGDLNLYTIAEATAHST